MRKKGWFIFIMIIFFSGIAVGFLDKNQTATNQEESGSTVAKPRSYLKIGIVTNEGGINDRSYNQLAWEGMLKARKVLGAEISYRETQGETSYAESIQRLIEDKNDLIWGIGILTRNDIKTAAESHPEQRFALMDSSFWNDNPGNMFAVTFKEQEASFLAGYIAGKMTKADHVGFIGGVRDKVIDRFYYGYKAGVKYGNPDCAVSESYADTFISPRRGKSLAVQMYRDGADIIFHAAGETGNGLIETARELNKFVIGVDRDQNAEAPDNVLTSVIKRVDNVIFDTAKQLEGGYWPGGTTIEYGLAEGGVDIAPSTDKLVPPRILQETEEIKNDIIAGNIIAPSNQEEYRTFINETVKKKE